jgi:hypothetical protein
MRLALRCLSLASLMLVAACAVDTDEQDAETDEAPVRAAQESLGEKLEPGEAALVKEIAVAATTQVEQSLRESPDRVAKRDAHPKAHGCVTGSFELNAQVPAELQVGTFKAGKRYDTWIRFSNGSNADDRKNDARGMAIKILGVDGERLLTGEEPTARTHDILLSNHHTFFLSNLADYKQFMEGVATKGNPLSFFISWNPLDWHLRAGYLAYQFTKQPISSPLTSRYWSAVPYKLGDQVVKYSARPCGDALDTSGRHADDANFLGKALKDGLASGAGACFDFMIQRRAPGMSVEDSTVTWSEDDAPFVPVGKIKIPAQTFDSPAQQKFCENLSFTPWHGTKEHRPLGSMNRTRKVVYEATSSARHRLNGARRVEPTDLTVR